MPDKIFRPVPKPRRRVLDRVAEKAERDRQAAAFRNAVWKRDSYSCQVCGRHLRRTAELVPDRGEVHHRLTRGAHPRLRYDIGNGVLLCQGCHARAHQGAITP